MKTIDVYALPKFVEPDRMKGASCAVIDVLRATTSMICAIASGATEVVPVLDIELAKQLRAEEPSGNTVLCGERKGIRIDGFDLGNSAQDFTPQHVAGKTLVFTTTNGTVAIHAARSAARIYLAALVNARAVVERLKDEDRVVILCSGTDGMETGEDLLVAGCLVSRLCEIHPDSSLNAVAKRVRTLWESLPPDTVIDYFRQSGGGRNLIKLGLGADIEDAAQLDMIDLAPQLDPETMRYTKRN